jgi:Na+/melibiose symporter-like transporter
MSDGHTALPFSTKFLYGFGSIAYGIKDNAFAYFLLFVYVQVFGLAPDLAGLAILVMLIFDAFSDPLIGYISDNTQSRWGRRHPFIYGSIIPVAMTFFLIWDPPTGASDQGLFWYLLVMGIGIRTAITLYEIPSTALGPELTQDYVERSSLIAFRQWFGWWGGLTMWNLLWVFVVYSSMNGTEDARYNADTWVVYGIACSIVMAIAILVTGIGTHKHIPQLHIPKDERLKGSRQKIGTVVNDIWLTLNVSRNYRILFIAYIVCKAASGLFTNLTLFYYSYYWELAPVDILTIGLTLFLAPVLGLKLTPTCSRLFGKRNTAISFFAAAMVLENALILLRVLDLLPSNESPIILTAVLVCHLAAITCIIVAGTAVGAMVFDTVEEVESSTGKRMEGTLLAARSFAEKCMAGVGAFSAGLILSFAAWPEDAKPGLVSQATLDTVGIYTVVASTALWLLGLFFIGKVRENKEAHAARLASLATKPQEA